MVPIPSSVFLDSSFQKPFHQCLHCKVGTAQLNRISKPLTFSEQHQDCNRCIGFLIGSVQSKLQQPFSQDIALLCYSLPFVQHDIPICFGEVHGAPSELLQGLPVRNKPLARHCFPNLMMNCLAYRLFESRCP